MALDTPPSRAPLSNYLVVDLSRALAGPHAAMMLGDLGARVIKVEPPGGDESRGFGPPFVGPEDSPVSTYFLSANRNKESVVLDLKTESGRIELESLVRRADVLIENFRPGVMERLGLGIRRLSELSPRLVVLSITGFGHDGPGSQRPGYDQIAQGEAGLMSLTGTAADGPTKVGVPITDVLAGMYGAYGVAAALADRERTGEGAVVRTSLLAAAIGAHAFQGTRWTVARDVGRPAGNHHSAIAPYGAFRCRDGLVQVAVGTQAQWRRFAHALGLAEDDPRFSTNTDRVENHHALVTAIEQALSARTRDEWLQRLGRADVPAGAIRGVDEVYAAEQVRAQGLLIDVDHPVLGKIQLPGPPLRMQRLDGRDITRREHRPPALPDEHHDEVSAWLAGQWATEEVGDEHPASEQQ